MPPTRIHNPGMSARERYFARQSVGRLSKQTKQPEVLRAPWMGWVPDLPPHIAGWKGYRDGGGLIAAPYHGRGLFMRHDEGFAQVSPASLPLSTGAYAITGLAQFLDNHLIDEVVSIAITAGEAGVDNVFARVTAPTWTAIAANAAATSPELDRETTWDHCVFNYGCPARAGGAITHNVVIFCGSDSTGPTSEVLVYPDTTAGTSRYDSLMRAGAAPGPTFRAASCETFDNRVHYLNTYEVATPHPNRHRWSAVGTADPTESIVGSGYYDFAEPWRQGRRIQSMRDHLVLYFEDGVVFQIPTGFYADAYRPKIISRTRGLLGTQALCSISPHLHFGIFTDGWYTLDSSGRWSESGRIILEETRGKSHELTKWKNTFYEDLDWEQKHRICCIYDNYRKTVRIAYPSRSSNSENYRILNYHWPTDSCWRDRYAKPVTAWGAMDVQTTAGTTWAAAVGAWDDFPGPWAEYAAQYREDVVAHGCGGQSQADTDLSGGYVFARDPNISTYDGVNPSYSYITHLQSRNPNPYKNAVFHRFGAEYLNTGGSNLLVIVGTDEYATYQVSNIPMNEGNLNTMQNGFTHFRLGGGEHGFVLQGTAPVAIRSLMPEMLVYDSDDREGQV